MALSFSFCSCLKIYINKFILIVLKIYWTLDPDSVTRAVWCLYLSLAPKVMFIISTRLSCRGAEGICRGYVPRKTERGLEPRLMISNTLNLSLCLLWSDSREKRQLPVRFVPFRVVSTFRTLSYLRSCLWFWLFSKASSVSPFFWTQNLDLYFWNQICPQIWSLNSFNELFSG